MSATKTKPAAEPTMREESLMGRLPLLGNMRVYNSFWVWVAGAFSYGAATWGLMTGGYLGSFLSAPEAIASLFLGQTIGLLICAAFTGVVCARYGIDAVDAAKPSFGVRGSQIVALAIILIMIGWILVLVGFTGNALEQFLTQTIGIEHNRLVLGLLTLVVVIACGVIAAGGPRIFASLYNWVAPAMVLLTIAMLIVLIAEYGLGDLWAMHPPAESQLPKGEGFALGVEVGAGFAFAYWISTGAMFRLTRTPRIAVQGAMFGWAVMTIPVIAVAIFSALALGSDDPSTWMYDLAGTAGGTAAIVFIILANISSTVMMFYIAGIAAQQAKPLARIPFGWLIAGMALPAVWVAFWPEKLFEWYPKFVAYNGVIIAPIVAVLTVDFFLLRRQSIDLRHVFTWKPNSKYWFWGGVNPVAIATVVFGILFYNWLYNPFTTEHKELFEWVSASLPTFVVCGVVYWLLMQAVVRTGRGAYPAGEGKAAVADLEPGDIRL
jgi:NCS1 family nucleobase:cation symporter-1